MRKRRALPSRGRAEPKASVNLKVRSVNLAPLFDLKPVRRAGAKHQPVLARFAGGQQADLRRPFDSAAGLRRPRGRSGVDA